MQCTHARCEMLFGPAEHSLCVFIDSSGGAGWGSLFTVACARARVCARVRVLYTCACTCARVRVHVYTCACTCVRVRVHVCMCVHTRVRARVRAHVRVCLCVYRTCTCACVHVLYVCVWPCERWHVRVDAFSGRVILGMGVWARTC